MRLVLTSTNLKIDEALSKRSEKEIIDDTKLYLRTRDECELRAVFSLVYFRGLLGLNNHSLMYFRGLLGLSNHSVHQIFSDRTGHPVFGGAMS